MGSIITHLKYVYNSHRKTPHIFFAQISEQGFCLTKNLNGLMRQIPCTVIGAKNVVGCFVVERHTDINAPQMLPARIKLLLNLYFV